MHELSIAHNIINLASQHIEADDKVVNLHVQIGALSGVVPQALQFCFGSAVSGTPLENSSLTIEELPVQIRCPQCGVVELHDVQSFLCPNCQLSAADMIQGRELSLISIEVEEL